MDLQLYLLCVMMSLSIETDVSILFNQETKKKKEETSVDDGIERKTLTGFYRTKHYQQREYIR